METPRIISTPITPDVSTAKRRVVSRRALGLMAGAALATAGVWGTVSADANAASTGPIYPSDMVPHTVPVSAGEPTMTSAEALVPVERVDLPVAEFVTESNDGMNSHFDWDDCPACGMG